MIVKVLTLLLTGSAKQLIWTEIDTKVMLQAHLHYYKYPIAITLSSKLLLSYFFFATIQMYSFFEGVEGLSPDTKKHQFYMLVQVTMLMKIYDND